MKSNMGGIDRIIRIALALLVGLLYMTGQIGGNLAIILGVIAVIFIATSFIGFCPLYAPFKISTKKS